MTVLSPIAPAPARFADRSISSRDSFVLAVSIGVSYYSNSDNERNLDRIIALLKQTCLSANSTNTASSSAALQDCSSLSASSSSVAITSATPISSTSVSPQNSAESTIPCITPQRFLLIPDSLYCYNEMISDPALSIEQAREISIKKSDEWLASTDGQLLQNALTWTAIIRWSNILKTQEYTDAIKYVNSLYIPKKERKAKEATLTPDQILFSQRVDSEVTSKFKDMRENNPSLILPPETTEHLHSYLLEECAEQMALARLYHPKYILYPGNINKAMSTIHDIINRDLSVDSRIMQWQKITLPPFNQSTPVQKSLQQQPPKPSRLLLPLTSSLSSAGIFSSNNADSPLLPPLSNRCQKINLSSIDGKQLEEISGKITHYTKKINGQLGMFQSTITHVLTEKLSGKTELTGLDAELYQNIIEFFRKIENDTSSEHKPDLPPSH